MKAISHTFLLLFIATYSLAQNDLVLFKHITTNNGLSQSTISSIAQDDDGFMWFGTHDGLNRYDGKSIKVYRNIPSNPKSLSHNFIQACL